MRVEPKRGPLRRILVMTRRDTLRLALIAAIASPLAAACGSGSRRSGAAAGLGLVKSDVERTAGEPDAIPEVVAAMHALAGGMYAQLAAERERGAVADFGRGGPWHDSGGPAGGRTADEMCDVLMVSSDARFHGGLNALSAHVEGLAGSQHRTDGSKAERRWSAPTS